MPLLVEDANIYSLASREFFETLDRFVPNETEYMAIARRHLPSTWQYSRRGVWYHCRPDQVQLPPCGWKIHVSATLTNAAAVLAMVSDSLAPLRIPFKFLVDVSAFRLLNSKRWPRGGSGKFITVYPASEGACGELLERLHQVTIGFVGPYILSDRRYRDSRVIHYRYGGFSSTTRRTLSGEPVYVITTPDGRVVDDERLPFFSLPDGIVDPFASAESVSDEADGTTIGNGRYTIETALAFANSGGVYLARDRETERQVVVKEARPFTTQSPRGTESVSLLKKEHRILSQIEDLGIAPRPLAFFQDWEHFYLVQEFIPGQNLKSFHQTTLNLALRPNPKVEDVEEFFATYRTVYSRVIEAMLRLHDRGITFGDLSPNNVLVADGTHRVTLIDFEGANENGVDTPPMLYTPGYAPVELIDGGMADFLTDAYSVGAVMLAGLMPINSVFALNVHGYEPLLTSFVRDLGFPPGVANCIRRLLATDRDKRATLSEALDCLHRPQRLRAPAVGTSEANAEEPSSLVDEMVAYIESVADFTRDDRLYPAAPYVFRTNPLSVAFGACGVASVLREITGTVRPEVRDWIRARPITAELYPPGLMVGMAGVSWALMDLGEPQRAESVLLESRKHPLLWTSADLFHGASGWGLAQLRMFAATEDEQYLANALDVARFLAAESHEQASGAYWTVDGKVHAGLGHGCAGISLFLLRLFQATGDERHLALGVRGLEFVLTCAKETADGGSEWAFQEGERTVTPYWAWGGAGIGAVLLRYNAVVESPVYRAAIDRVIIDCERKYSIFPGLHLGLAGVGEFFLDLRSYGYERATADAGALKALAGLLHFKLRRAGGVAFPGETRSRISCDFATGSAGIAHFVNRLVRGGNAPYMLDELDPVLGQVRGHQQVHAADAV